MVDKRIDCRVQLALYRIRVRHLNEAESVRSGTAALNSSDTSKRFAEPNFSDATQDPLQIMVFPHNPSGSP
eukprot:4715123-Amphidinium_carterae.1